MTTLHGDHPSTEPPSRPPRPSDYPRKALTCDDRIAGPLIDHPYDSAAVSFCAPSERGGLVTVSDRRRRGKVELAVARTLRDCDRSNPAHDGLAASALMLARSLDEGAGLAVAAVARELRATLTALTSTSGGDDDGFDALVAGLSAPLRDGA